MTISEVDGGRGEVTFLFSGGVTATSPKEVTVTWHLVIFTIFFATRGY